MSSVNIRSYLIDQFQNQDFKGPLAFSTQYITTTKVLWHPPTGDIYITAFAGLGLVRAGAFTSTVWTRLVSEVSHHCQFKCLSAILPD